MYYWIFGLLGLAALGLDQWVKAWTTAHLALGETTPLLPGLVEEEQKSLPRMSANRQSIYQIIIAPNEDKSNELGVL